MTTLKATTDGMLTVAQVADYLQLNKLTVYKYIREGKIPALKIGRVIRVRAAEIAEFLEGQRVTPHRPDALLEHPRTSAPQERRNQRRRKWQTEDARVDPRVGERGEPREAVITISPMDLVVRGLH